MNYFSNIILKTTDILIFNANPKHITKPNIITYHCHVSSRILEMALFLLFENHKESVDLKRLNYRPCDQSIKNHLLYSYPKHEMNAGENVHFNLEI